MRRILLSLALIVLYATPGFAQQAAEEAPAFEPLTRAAVPLSIATFEPAKPFTPPTPRVPLSQLQPVTPAPSFAVPQFVSPAPMPLRRSLPTLAGPPSLVGEDGTYLGTLSSNPYDPNSVSNPYGRYGSRYSPDSVNNPYGVYGSRYSPYSATNPYATQAPKIVNPYLGRLSANPYAPDSTSNRFGPYGSPYSPSSITNPYSPYGSPFSPSSVTNPYAIAPLPPLVPLSPLR
jgi:hypothetical protein